MYLHYIFLTYNYKLCNYLNTNYYLLSVMELINNGFKLNDGEEFVCVKALPLRFQILIDAELGKYK